jgi:hypothetical protein
MTVAVFAAICAKEEARCHYQLHAGDSHRIADTLDDDANAFAGKRSELTLWNSQWSRYIGSPMA